MRFDANKSASFRASARSIDRVDRLLPSRGGIYRCRRRPEARSCPQITRDRGNVGLKLAGAAPAPLGRFPVRAGFAYRKKPGRRDYLRARLERDPDGLVALKYPHDGSAILSSIVQSDGLVVLDECQGDLAAGSIVDFIPFVEALS